MFGTLLVCVICMHYTWYCCIKTNQNYIASETLNLHYALPVTRYCKLNYKSSQFMEEYFITFRFLVQHQVYIAYFIWALWLVAFFQKGGISGRRHVFIYKSWFNTSRARVWDIYLWLYFMGTYCIYVVHTNLYISI